MQTRLLGEVAVSAMGIGGMQFSFAEPIDDDRSIRAIHAAIDAGVTLIDTALAYTTADARVDPETGIQVSHNEELVRRALASHPQRDAIVIATKSAHFHRPGETVFDGRPEVIKANCEMSLRALGVEVIDLYQMHWPDPKVALEDSMGAFVELQQEGKIRMVGGSNFSIEQIDAITAFCPLVSIQNVFNPLYTQERKVIAHCKAKGIAFLPWSPLGGGDAARSMGQTKPAFQRVADAHGVSVAQTILAWHLAQGEHVIPIPSSRRPEGLLECLGALDVALTPDEVAMLDAEAGQAWEHDQQPV